MKKIFILLISSLYLYATDISTYLVGDYVETSKAKDKLVSAGFEVVADYESVKDGTTIIFTNSELKAQAANEKRAHIAVLRMFVDSQLKTISITNPTYFGRAFMQDDYNDKVFEKQLASIKSAFPGLKGSKDHLDDDDIEGYHFMFGMPYYEDIEELAEGKTSQLVAKAKSYNGGKSLVFSLKLSNNSYLLGYDLGEVTKKFVSTIGRANAAVLPYCISVEDGEATMLNAKYYLSVSYPQLSMGQFSDISEIPDAIVEDLTKPFK